MGANPYLRLAIASAGLEALARRRCRHWQSLRAEACMLVATMLIFQGLDIESWIRY